MNKNNQVIKYNITDAAIAKLQKKYGTVPDASTKIGYVEIKEAIAELRPLRVSIEKRRKELKQDSIAWGRAVDAEAKRITTLLLCVEEPLKKAKQEEDQKKERERVAEVERVKAIQRRISEIEQGAEGLLGADSKAIMTRSKQVSAHKITGYDEFSEEAEEVKQATLAKLDAAWKERLSFEAAKKEAAMKEAELEKQAAQQRARQEELERQEQEQRRQQEEIDNAKRREVEIERERLEAIRVEAEAKKAKEIAEKRALEQLPDIDKVTAYLKTLIDIGVPAVVDSEVAELLDAVIADIQELVDTARKKIQTLKSKVQGI